MSFGTKSLQEKVIKTASPREFYQIFTIPATDKNESLKVTYTIVGTAHGDIPTILCITGMFVRR
jgi:hypothetical protein